MKDKVTLYIATHNITGKKYFGKTTKWFTTEDLQKNYHGSGVYWKKHKKKYGEKDVTMEIYQICSLNESDEDYVKPIAIKFSEENNIVKSKEWANQKLEDGFDGGSIAGELHPCYGKPLSEERCRKMSEERMNIPKTEDHKKKISEAKMGIPRPEETKEKIANSMIGEKNHFYGKHHTEETKEKLRIPKSEEYKEASSQNMMMLFPTRECPYCKLVGSGTAMNRYHFDKCKYKG